MAEVLPDNVRFDVYTDSPDIIARSLSGRYHVMRPLPMMQLADVFVQLTACYRMSIEAAPLGTALAFLNADMFVSLGAFAAAEKHFAQGKRAIFASATRTVSRPHGLVPLEAPSPRALAAWSLANMHPICRECIYPGGSSGSPWAVYFIEHGNVILRAFHLHPFAFHKTRELEWGNVATAPDVVLTEMLDHSEIHVVTDPDELVLAESSPIEKRFPNNGPLTPEKIAAWAMVNANATHRWFFTHRIVLSGGNDTGCDAVAAETLAILEDQNESRRQQPPGEVFLSA